MIMSQTIRATFLGTLLLFFIPGITISSDVLPGEYQLLDEPAMQEPGKVVFLEFADFYCPHCHLFEKMVTSKLKKRVLGIGLRYEWLGSRSSVASFPLHLKCMNRRRLWEKALKCGNFCFIPFTMKAFRFFDKGIRRLLIREVGLDINDFEKGMASGEPYKALEKGKIWGERLGVSHTPTIVLNGNVRVDNLNLDNIRTVIKGLLEKG